MSLDTVGLLETATDIVLISNLYQIAQSDRIDEVLKIVNYLRKTLYVSIDPHYVSDNIYVRLPRSTTTTRGTSIDDTRRYAGTSISNLAIELHVSGRAYALNPEGFDPMVESIGAVVYEYSQRVDAFWIEGVKHLVPIIDPQSDSQFCGRTFFDLASALEDYKKTYALSCKCPVLKSAWYDDARLFFKAHPENVMRDSLKHFLDIRLAAGYEIRAEQNVDDSHPIDIKVTKQLQPRLMLIEIKWLGDSMNEEGTASNISYRDSRARSGVHQLASYLDANREQAPYISTVGYYVIFDGRRSNLKVGKTDYTREQLVKYEFSDINFGEIEALGRSDFVEPIRMYITPRIGVTGSKAGSS